MEGAAEKNPMIRRGYSRDHRPDCQQMVIALIVNSEGFPFRYETFDGNRADVSTMETILRTRVTAYKVAHPPFVGFIARLRPNRFPGSDARKLSSPTNNCRIVTSAKA